MIGPRLGILALDMATSTGWALHDRNGYVTSGVQKFELGRGESPGMRFLRFRAWLREMKGIGLCTCRVGGLCSCYAVDVIAYERAHHRGGAATALCVGLVTVMLEEAARLGIEVAPVHTATLKKHATGKGNAGKDDMVRAAVRRWGPELEAQKGSEGPLPEDDEADALCILAWALDEVGQKSTPEAAQGPWT